MAVTKRIFQLSKEFERDEKEIIAFLTAQGIKVSNRLSAVSEETYNMLKAKFMAPPEPEPAPAPAPAPAPKETPAPAPEVKEAAPAESSAPQSEQQKPQFAGKKKKKKFNPPQAAEATEQSEDTVKEVSDIKFENMVKRTNTVLVEGIKAGNEFIRSYRENSGTIRLDTKGKPQLTPYMDMWGILYNLKFDYPDSSPVRYWQAVAKLATKAFKILNTFGLKNREHLAEMRQSTAPLGAKYAPREIFTEEENQKFAEQQLLLYQTFGHGVGLVNDNLYALKLKAERMKVRYERMNFLAYATDPQDELRSGERVPFSELAESVAFSVRGVARRFLFYSENKGRIENIVQKFFDWLDGYAKLKEQGAPAEKLEKYLELEQKFVDIAEFMSFDNLIDYKKIKKNKPTAFDKVLELLIGYRDNMDDPDAERNFKYKVRGVINTIYKPKEYVFLYSFADLEPNKDYRPPEEIAAAEDASEQENPAADDEA